MINRFLVVSRVAGHDALNFDIVDVVDGWAWDACERVREGRAGLLVGKPVALDMKEVGAIWSAMEQKSVEAVERKFQQNMKEGFKASEEYRKARAEMAAIARNGGRSWQLDPVVVSQVAKNERATTEVVQQAIQAVFEGEGLVMNRIGPSVWFSWFVDKA